MDTLDRLTISGAAVPYYREIDNLICKNYDFPLKVTFYHTAERRVVNGLSNGEMGKPGTKTAVTVTTVKSRDGEPFSVKDDDFDMQAIERAVLARESEFVNSVFTLPPPDISDYTIPSHPHHWNRGKHLVTTYIPEGERQISRVIIKDCQRQTQHVYHHQQAKQLALSLLAAVAECERSTII